MSEDTIRNKITCDYCNNYRYKKLKQEIIAVEILNFDLDEFQKNGGLDRMQRKLHPSEIVINRDNDDFINLEGSA